MKYAFVAILLRSFILYESQSNNKRKVNGKVKILKKHLVLIYSYLSYFKANVNELNLFCIL